jgi:hypothetical protein
MKKLLVFVGIVAAAWFVWMFGQDQGWFDTDAPSQPIAQSPTPVPPAPQPINFVPMAPSDVDANPYVSAPSATNAPKQSSSPSINPSNRMEAAVIAAAKEADVRIVAMQMQGQNMNLSIAWNGDSAGNGGEFLDILRKNGTMRDFDTLNQGVGNDPSGRRTYTMHVLLKP